MQNPWDNDPVIGKVSGPIYGAAKPVDPYRAEDQQMQRDNAARADRNAARADATANRGIAIAERTAGNQNFDNLQKLRTAYESTPAVKEYRVGISSLGAALNRAGDATGDTALIYDYAKAMDPGSVVREAEMGMAAGGASVIDQAAANLKKQFGIEGGGQLSPELRERLKREISTKVAAQNKQYSDQRIRYAEDAKASGFDPARVTGNHDGDTYMEQIKQYEAQQGGGAPADKMPYEAFQGQMQQIIGDQTKSPEQRFQAAMELAQQAGQQVDPEQVKAAIGAGRARIYEGEQPQSIPAQLGEATGNVLAGIGQGIAALPDMAANAVGATLALPAEALGFDNVARDLRNPTTIGGLIEQGIPTPQDGVGQGVRIASQFGGGMIGFPQRAAQSITNRILGGGPPPPPVNALSGAPIMQAAQRQGVDLLPADVGGQTVKSFTSAAAQAPFSRGSVVNVSRRAAGQMDAAASRAAGNEGNVLPVDEAGEVVRRGGEKFVKATRERASRYYDRAHELADGVKIMPERALNVIDEQIALKSQAGEMSGDIVGELEKVRRSLGQQGGVTAVGLREARSILGSMARNDKLKGTDAKRIFGMVLDAASEDMATSLTAAGKEGAARMFRRADTLWKERITEIDDVLEPVIGKGRSGEDIVASVESMARGQRGGVSRLGRMLATLPPEEKGDISATVIDRLGRASASVQDDTGSIFSSETFLTNWNKMSGKGKAALFGSGETRRNLDDIAMIAAGRRDTASLASKSNTPIGLTANATPYAALGVASPPAAVVGVSLQYATGKLLASPRFTRWLARAPKAEGAMKGHIARLTTIASENPAISDDILGLQQRLTESLGQPGRLAAEQDVNNVGP